MTDKISEFYTLTYRSFGHFPFSSGNQILSPGIRFLPVPTLNMILSENEFEIFKKFRP